MKLNPISETINRALRSAGLTSGEGNSGRIQRLIDNALKSAGLHAKTLLDQRPTDAAEVTDIMESESRATGRFLSRTHTGSKGSRDYKLYVPSSYDGGAMPLLVMLHGCKQNPDDFAAGTRMNEHAERHGFLVAYPEQTARANGANCWNWFEAAQQAREGQEPSLIAGIVGEIQRGYTVRPSSVFAAGLSAGAAMAVILGSAYPEVFAGVAAHSGLPLGAAHDVPSAFAAMHGNAARAVESGHRGPGVRTLVLHGDADRTVVLANGDAIGRQAVRAFEQDGDRLQRVESGVESGGRRCTRIEFIDGSGVPAVEEWIVHGAGHAWSGGSNAGSFADPKGPDASQLVVKFFLSAGASRQ